jgi:hypothetical protein
MKKLLLIVVACFAMTSIAHAHNGMEHVMGTVTAVTASEITVKTKDGTIQTVAVTNATKYLHGTAAIAQKDVKIGERVVVEASKKDNHLVASEVKLGPSGTAKMDDMPGMNMGTASKSH